MTIVESREDESIDLLLRRYKRAVEKAGTVMLMRRHEFYEKPKWKRKRKAIACERRRFKKPSGRFRLQRRAANANKRKIYSLISGSINFEAQASQS